MDFAVLELAGVVAGRWVGAPPPGDAAIRGVGIDSREELAGRLFAAIEGERADGHDFLAAARARGAVAALVEREMPAPIPQLLVRSTRAALADLARATRARYTGGVSAITGSCGKTTTRRLLASILDRIAPTVQSPKSFNNDLGVPLTILALRGHHRHLVCEIGMNAPGEIEPLARLVRPQVAVITSIGHVHLEALGSIAAIAREKASIVTGLEPGGALVLPAESAEAVDALGAIERAISGTRAHAARRLTFGRSAGDARLLARSVIPEGSLVELGGPWGMISVRLALPGEHNAMNALAAACAAHLLGAPSDAIRDGLSAVRPSEMRFVRERLGPVVVVNDAYNANPDAMRAAISAFAESERGAARRVTVLGDMLELGPRSEELHGDLGGWLARAFEGAPPALAVFVGDRSRAGAAAFHEALAAAPVLADASSTLLHLPDTSASSARMLWSALRPGDVLLLKASRGAALERLLPALAELAASSAAPAIPAAATSSTAAAPAPSASVSEAGAE